MKLVNLYKHQIDGLKISKDLNHVAFYWDMGLGKTFAGSEKMMDLKSGVNLIVCQKSKVDDWLDHMRDHYFVTVLDLTKKHDFEIFIERTYFPADQTVGVINYDLVWRKKQLLDLTDFTLLLDESSLIQNDGAKRTRFILKLKPSNVILLSGTPTGGKYEKLWTQMHLLGWKITKEMYLSQFVNYEYLDLMDGRSIPLVTGYKNVERLKRKMKDYGCQFLKTDEVFDLPQQTFQKIMIPASKEYKKFKKDRIVEVDGETLVGDTTLTRMLYERILCGQYSEDKLKAFVDLVESTDDRLIVFYNFNEELNRMQDALMKISFDYTQRFSVVNGRLKALSNYEHDEDSITFIQYQAGAMGLNLQKACRMVFFSLPLSSELYEQAKKRIHRIGQKNHCFYYPMIVKGSIEEKILKTLEQRKDYTEKLFEKEETE